MKHPSTYLLIASLGVLGLSNAMAQDRIYRCGNEYINLSLIHI